MSIATSGAKSAVLDALEEAMPLSSESREALGKLNIRELLVLIKDISKVVSNTIMV